MSHPPEVTEVVAAPHHQESEPSMASTKSEVIIALFCFLSAELALGQDKAPVRIRSEHSHCSESTCLEGLEAVGVLVENLHDAAKRVGVTRDLLSTDVELKLRSAGVPIDEDAEPYVYVNIIVIETALPDGTALGLVASTSVSLVAPVFLTTNSWWTYTDIWESVEVVVVPPSEARKVIRQSVKDLVDRFTLEYLRANPGAKR